MKASTASKSPFGRPVHGKANTYTNWGCRCDACRKAHAAQIRDLRARRAEWLRKEGVE